MVGELRTVEVVGFRLGPISQRLTPGFSWCHRCGTTWPFVDSHTTFYADHRGCFPLCKQCWAECKTPAERLPYYRELWDEWTQRGERDQDKWEAIQAAVEKGL